MNSQQQQGQSLISWLIWVVFIGFYVMLAIKLLPVYYKHHLVKKHLNALATTVQVDEVINAHVLGDALERRLHIDNIRQFDVRKLKIKRENKKTLLYLNYDVKIPIMGNAAVLLHFEDEAEVKK